MQIIRNTIKYKDSGIEWIGKIPKDWNLIKGKYLYSIDTGKLDADAEDLDGKYPFFTCSMHPKKINKYSFDCEALLVAGNGLVGFTQYYEGKFDAYQRTYVLSKFNNINPMFLKYYVSNNLSIEVNPNSLGSVIQFIKLGDLQNFNICIPPLDEQQKIVDFLDKKCGEIDNAIETEKNVIEKLKEYKQSVITETVTKGLDKSVELKDSGIEWIGKIPKHWELMPLKFSLKQRFEKNTPIKTEERLSLSIGLGVTLYSEKTTNLDRFKDDCSQYKLAYPKDLIINSMNVIVGAVGISKYYGCVSPAYYVLYSVDDNRFKTEFFDYLFKTSTIKKFLFSIGRGIMAIERGNDRVNTCRLKVSAYDLGRLIFPIPNIKEQNKIMNYLDNKCSQIDETIKKKEELIEKLTEYKKSLIYECVTGKRRI